VREKRKLHAAENVFTLLMLVFSVIVLILAYQISGFSSISSPGMFPMLAAVVMVISLIFLLLDNRKAENPDADGLKEELHKAAKDIFNPVFLVYIGIIIIYMLIMEPLHFLPSSFIFLLGSMIYLKGSTPLKSLFISLGTLGGIYLIFHYLFRVVLP
jgi:putative tricarboxylic transport membrane protein